MKGTVGKLLIGLGFAGLAYALFKGSSPKTETQSAAAPPPPPAPTQSNVLGGLAGKKKSKRKRSGKSKK